MTTVPEIAAAIQHLSAEDRKAFRAWYEEFDAEEWDRQIEDDYAVGRLDGMIAEAKADLEAGRCTEL